MIMKFDNTDKDATIVISICSQTVKIMCYQCLYEISLSKNLSVASMTALSFAE